MPRIATFRECFLHGAWARDKLLDLARDLTDAQLDRPFPIGLGSLRATLQHLYGSEHVAEPARLDLETLQTYFRYGHWAWERACTAAGKLSDERLDRPFEMGRGTLRKTLLHIRDAEQWWSLGGVLAANDLVSRFVRRGGSL